MKLFLRLILWLVAISVIVYGIKNVPLTSLNNGLSNRSIYVERNGVGFLPDWDNEKVLTEINTLRREEGLTELKLNDKLGSAALSRLSVIITEEDYTGETTGLTREVAIKNADYNASVIGDLVLLDFFKTNNPITFWNEDETTKNTLHQKDFVEAGIAVKNDDDKVNVYVLLVAPKKAVAPTPGRVSWGGPELWEAVNKRRVELGVNPLGQRSEFCTIASIRLNQLLELRKLDGHAGFVPVLDREDLKWISEKYNVSEYLAQGYQTPEDTIKAWENTLGHRSLLAGGEYVWGCVYAQSTFAVAIAAY